MFARRSHKTFIKLKPDEEILYRLPPMSQAPDLILIEANNRYFRKGIGGTTVIDGNPTDDLELELRHSEHLSVPGTNRITYGVLPGQVIFGDDLWRLRVKRIKPNSESVIPDQDGRLEYMITAQYPSQLPILERRIAASFFHDGFEENWNRQQYIRVILSGSSIIVKFREDLARLYNLPLSGYVISTGPLSFEPTVELTSHKLDIGAGPLPGGSGNAPFFSLKAGFPAVKLVLAIDHVIDPTIDLSAFFMTFRFYLRNSGKVLEYHPFFDTDVELEFGGLVNIVNLFEDEAEKVAIALAKKKIEDGLYHLQRPEGGPSQFGNLLTPWLVGGPINMDPLFMINDLHSIGYAPGPSDILRPDGAIEPATGELIVRYVGPRPKPEPKEAEDIPLEGITDDGSIPLFDLPEEEPDPVPGTGPFGVDPTPVGQPPDIGKLAKINLIVVLMQENRSFDQVLGYLSRDKINPKVDGLLPPDDPDHQKQMNRFNGRNFPPQKADKDNPSGNPPRPSATAWPHFTGPAGTFVSGPCHDTACVRTQMAQIEGFDMGGFVSDFALRTGETTPGGETKD